MYTKLLLAGILVILTNYASGQSNGRISSVDQVVARIQKIISNSTKEVLEQEELRLYRPVLKALSSEDVPFEAGFELTAYAMSIPLTGRSDKLLEIMEKSRSFSLEDRSPLYSTTLSALLFRDHNKIFAERILRDFAEKNAYRYVYAHSLILADPQAESLLRPYLKEDERLEIARLVETKQLNRKRRENLQKELNLPVLNILKSADLSLLESQNSASDIYGKAQRVLNAIRNNQKADSADVDSLMSNQDLLIIGLAYRVKSEGVAAVLKDKPNLQTCSRKEFEAWICILCLDFDAARAATKELRGGALVTSTHCVALYAYETLGSETKFLEFCEQFDSDMQKLISLCVIINFELL